MNYDLIIGLDTVDSLSIKKNSKTFEIEKITVNGFDLTPLSVFSKKFLVASASIEIEPKSSKIVTFSNPGFSKTEVVTLWPHQNRPKFFNTVATTCIGSDM